MAESRGHADELFREIGYALSMWQRVEDYVCGIYLCATRPEFAQPAAAAFHSLQSFGQQLRMTDEAAKVLLVDPSEGMTAWKALRRRLQDGHAHRNILAHAGLGFIVDDDSEARAVLRAALTDPRAKNRSPVGAREAAEFAAEFRALGADALNFVESLRAVKGPQPAP